MITLSFTETLHLDSRTSHSLSWFSCLTFPFVFGLHSPLLPYLLILQHLGLSPRTSSTSTLWVGDPASALLWHYLTSVAAPACLVLLALSAVGSNAALPRTLPSISYDSSPLLRQFSSPTTVQPQQHRQPQTADLLCARHMLGPECRLHSNWDVFS